jgi:hypothetical protein
MIAFASLLFLVCIGFPMIAQAAGDTLAEVNGLAITAEEVENLSRLS